MLNETVLRLRDEVRDIGARRTGAEQELRRAQMDLTDSNKRCSVAEAALEVANKVRFNSVIVELFSRNINIYWWFSARLQPL